MRRKATVSIEVPFCEACAVGYRSRGTLVAAILVALGLLSVGAFLVFLGAVEDSGSALMIILGSLAVPAAAACVAYGVRDQRRWVRARHERQCCAAKVTAVDMDLKKTDALGVLPELVFRDPSYATDFASLNNLEVVQEPAPDPWGLDGD
jgi:hypothetical protein